MSHKVWRWWRRCKKNHFSVFGCCICQVNWKIFCWKCCCARVILVIFMPKFFQYWKIFKLFSMLPYEVKIVIAHWECMLTCVPRESCMPFLPMRAPYDSPSKLRFIVLSERDYCYRLFEEWYTQINECVTPSVFKARNCQQSAAIHYSV